MRVSKTAFDFRKAKPICKDIHNVNLKATLGYDHNYILKGEHAAHVGSEVMGIIMDIFTDMPCLQFYGGGLCYDNRPGKTKNKIYLQNKKAVLFVKETNSTALIVVLSF